MERIREINGQSPIYRDAHLTVDFQKQVVTLDSSLMSLTKKEFVHDHGGIEEPEEDVRVRQCPARRFRSAALRALETLWNDGLAVVPSGCLREEKPTVVARGHP